MATLKIICDYINELCIKNPNDSAEQLYLKYDGVNTAYLIFKKINRKLYRDTGTSKFWLVIHNGDCVLINKYALEFFSHSVSDPDLFEKLIESLKVIIDCWAI